ncbi:hypothetical protein [uncultured Sphingomonas sp.]|uniref:hypothetical protein n=1 Tax=uncultured Sphingomonas sp. TaxID=158754 RepID=UPI0025E93657|nr:hypothetical protein [uncultured Sphingomonas sp.]
MTRKNSGTPIDRVRHAQGAARETIGKLIGDDAEIRQGRKQQEAAGRKTSTDAAQEPKEQE